MLACQAHSEAAVAKYSTPAARERVLVDDLVSTPPARHRQMWLATAIAVC